MKHSCAPRGLSLTLLFEMFCCEICSILWGRHVRRFTCSFTRNTLQSDLVSAAALNYWFTSPLHMMEVISSAWTPSSRPVCGLQSSTWWILEELQVQILKDNLVCGRRAGRTRDGSDRTESLSVHDSLSADLELRNTASSCFPAATDCWWCLKWSCWREGAGGGNYFMKQNCDLVSKNVIL